MSHYLMYTNFFNHCVGRAEILLIPCFQLSLYLKSIQTQNHCSFVTKNSDAILFSRFPEWRGWRWQLSSLNHSAAQFFLRTEAEDISVSLSGLWGETSNVRKWGKDKETLLTTPRLIYALIGSKQPLLFSFLQMLQHNIWKIKSGIYEQDKLYTPFHI